MSDGGEGLLDVLGGANRTSIVTGPLGAPVEAAWRLAQRTAVIEMARASGLALAGGRRGQRPAAGDDDRHRRAHRPGARAEGARRIIVGLGGSATTDGGLGAVEALRQPGPAAHASSWRWRATCAPASSTRPPCSPRRRAPAPAQVGLLTARLDAARRALRATSSASTSRELDGGGAAGGLGRRAGRARRPARAGVRPRRRARRPRRAARRRRRRRHRRGPPRRPEPRRQGRRRGVRAGRRRRHAGGRDRRRRRRRRRRRAAAARRRRRSSRSSTRFGERARAHASPAGASSTPPPTRSAISPRLTVVVTPTVGRRWHAARAGGRAVDRRRPVELGERLAGGVGADHHEHGGRARGPCRSAAGRASPRSCSPPRSAATDVGDGLRGGVAGGVVDDRRGEVGVAGVVAGLAHRVAGGLQRRGHRWPPSRRRRWRWRPTTVAPVFVRRRSSSGRSAPSDAAAGVGGRRSSSRRATVERRRRRGCRRRRRRR